MNTVAKVERERCGHGCRFLLVLDNVPLQQAAWRDLSAARKRLEKATRDLHRHEQVDQPGFRAWIGATFPELVSSVRELAMQVVAKERMVGAVMSESMFTGRTPRTIWREWQKREANPAENGSCQDGDRRGDPGQTHAAAGEGGPFGNGSGDGFGEDELDALFEEFCARLGLDPNDPAVQSMRSGADCAGNWDTPWGSETRASDDAREIYRRLVQVLHPDRGGEWTPQRARIWHQVQEAWMARDVDMLARLEAEWEIAADRLSAASPLGRLRAALEELHAARRDTERKIRLYRKGPEWRFSISPPSARLCNELREALEHDQALFRRQLAELEATISLWGKSPKKRSRSGSASAPKPKSGGKDKFMPQEERWFAVGGA